MKRSVVIALAVTAILLIVLFAIFGSGSSKKFNWMETYKENSVQPYGTKVVRSMLDDFFPDGEVKDIKTDLPTDLPLRPDGGANYVFVGEAMFLDTADVEQLLEFVSNGNNAFISCKSLPYDLMFYLYYHVCLDEFGLDVPWNDLNTTRDTMALMNFFHNDLLDSLDYEYRYVSKNVVRRYNWHYLDSIYFCNMDNGFSELGSFKDRFGREHVNFAMIPYMEPDEEDDPGGMFYIHTNPIAFTNFQMVDEIGKGYAEKVLSHLSEGDTYWDAYSRIKEVTSRRRNSLRSNTAELTLGNQTPLKYILENKHLSWAWYTLVGMGILYLMFRAKRRQRIIPVHEANTNTSLEFISTIGALYFNKQNHLKLCQQKMKMFLSFIRNRYGISTKKKDDIFMEKLSKLSSVDQKELSSIFDYYNNINRSSVVSDETLKGFHQALEEIYKKCK